MRLIDKLRVILKRARDAILIITGRPKPAFVFLLYSAIAIPAMAIVTPPFQVSDELSHYQRADLVSRGHMVGERRGTLSGGVVSIDLSTVFDLFWPIILHPGVKATRRMFEKAAPVHWSSGYNFTTFENTSIYPPHFYVPSALGIVLGRAASLPVLSTLYLSRLLTGFTALAIAAMSISVAGSAALWFFAVLMLPMSLSSMASVSQEALLLSTSAWAAALFVANARREREQAGDFVILCAALAAVAMARPPYVLLAALPLLFRGRALASRVIGCLSVLGAAALWSMVSSKYAYVKYGIGTANPPDQIAYLLHNPLAIPTIAWNTIAIDGPMLANSFIGRLGWLDLWLPGAYHVCAWIGLGLAAICVSGPRSGDRTEHPIVIAAALLLSVAAVFAALYLSWSPVGFHYAGGAQGRYFIPLALFLPALWSGPREDRFSSAPWRLAASAVLAFPIVSFAVLMWGLVDRYYLT